MLKLVTTELRKKFRRVLRDWWKMDRYNLETCVRIFKDHCFKPMLFLDDKSMDKALNTPWDGETVFIMIEARDIWVTIPGY